MLGYQVTTGIRSADVGVEMLMNNEDRDGRLGPEDHFMLQGSSVERWTFL